MSSKSRDNKLRVRNFREKQELKKNINTASEEENSNNSEIDIEYNKKKKN